MSTSGFSKPHTASHIAGLKTFLTHQYYEGTVAFLPAEDNLGNPRDKIKCMTGCHICEQGANNGQLLSGDHVDKMAEENSDKGKRL